MMLNKYLNLGSIVKLNETEKKFMIIGYEVSTSSEGSVVYDYLGCLYPEGVFDTEQNFLFNHDQIEKVLFEGYLDEEGISFKTDLAKYTNRNNILNSVN